MEKSARERLQEASAIRGEACVTITMNTHRTGPDYLKDPILLKNLLRDAEHRLKDEHGDKVAALVMGKLNQLAEGIDHSHNLESMVLFANKEVSGLAKLPVAVTDRVSLDDHFVTRDVLRALQRGTRYHVLWLNRHEARLIQAFNGLVEQETRGDFPIKNNVAATDSAKQVADRNFGQLVEEYFNRVDKALVKVLNANPLPVVLATEARNVDHYRNVADKKEFLAANFNPSREDLTPLHLVEEAWKAYAPVAKQRYDAQVQKLGTAISAGKLLTDPSEIWRAIGEGRGDTLFVKEGFFQPAVVQENGLQLLPQSEREQPGAVDDIINEMIQRNQLQGGNTVFVSGNELEQYNGLALAARY